MKIIGTYEMGGKKYDLMEAERNLAYPCSKHCVFDHFPSCKGEPKNRCTELNEDRRFWRIHKD